MSKRKKESIVLSGILKKIAPALGASVLIEPVWGIAGQITFKSGQRSYFRYNTLDLNPMGSSEIAKDKDYANFFMEKMGYKTVPQSRTFFSPAWGEAIGVEGRGSDAAYAYARKLGFPVVVKPNSGSQGSDVSVAHTKQEFYRSLRAVFVRDRVAIVQPHVAGFDYRIVVLDQEIISAYRRIPLCVIGDGRSSIMKLIEKKQKQFEAEGRDTKICLDDPRMFTKLKRQKLKMDSVPAKGQTVYLLDNANLSTGGDSVDVTEEVHPHFKKLAVALTKDMGLRLCGVDLIINGDISQATDTYCILEINSAPGLDHYAKIGKSQKKIVESLYSQVLRHMER